MQCFSTHLIIGTVTATKSVLVKLSLIGLLGSFIFNGTFMAIAEPILWQCEAAGDQRSYLVHDLAVLGATVDLYIYGDSHYGTWLETTALRRTTAEAAAPGWVGQTTDGQTLKVTALAGDLVFAVDSSRYGKAVGRCIRHTPFN